MAASPAAIEQSTFIWNPNPIAFFAVLALAAAFHARTGARSKRAWWAIAIGAAGAVMELHVLGAVFLIAMLVIALFEVRRDRSLVVGFAGGVGLVIVLLLPLVVHELRTGFLEARLMLDYLRTDTEPLGGGPVAALAFTLLRVVGWPFVGVVTDVPAAAAILLAVVVGLAAVGLLRARANEAVGLRWLLAILAWSVIELAFSTPSLQRVVAGLPNDHYHAFLDPIVVILVAVPAANLFGGALDAWRTTRRPIAAVAAAAVWAGLAAFVLVGVLRRPPPVDPNGGWPALRAAGERIVAKAGGVPGVVVSLPDFKSAEQIRFPMLEAQRRLGGPSGAAITTIVVVCDRLFTTAIGAPCGGPAEDRFTGIGAPSGRGLIDRFDASPRISISVYLPVVTP
jgi:hypothetical protein